MGAVEGRVDVDEAGRDTRRVVIVVVAIVLKFNEGSSSYTLAVLHVVNIRDDMFEFVFRHLVWLLITLPPQLQQLDDRHMPRSSIL